MEKKQFRIEGMSCVNCAKTVENAIQQVKGVQSTSVHFANAKATVVFDPTQVADEQIFQAVKQAGYQAIPFDHSVEALRAVRQKEVRTAFQLFCLSFLFSLPFFVQMIAMIFGYEFFVSPSWQLILATCVQFGCGWIFYRSAYYALKAKRGNMDLLIALGTTAAYGFSLAVYFNHFSQSLYFESSAIIITLVLFGRWLETLTKTRASLAVEKLLQLQPTTALIETNGELIEIQASLIRLKDCVVVRPGDRIPVDGVVLKGESFVNESMLTGESQAVFKQKGAKVYAATINDSHSLWIEAQKIGSQTVLASIVHLVEKAQASKAPIQRLADQISAFFVPLVLLISALTWIGWIVTTGQFAIGLMNAIAVIVIACPCALGLATPTVIMIASGLGAQFGILFKEAASLEQAERIKALLFDKTGTLTEGKLIVKKIYMFNSYQTKDVLKYAASLESLSSHPFARAIVQEAKEKNIQLNRVDQFENFAGKGVSGLINGQTYYLGSLAFAQDLGVSYDESVIQQLLTENEFNLVILWKEKEVLGYITLVDQLRMNSHLVIQELKKRHIHPLIITGDQQDISLKIARQLSIEEVYAQLLPAEKTAQVIKAKQKWGTVGMVGEGINDAPSLAQADVSFSLRLGSDIAIEAADITLMRDDLMGIIEAIDLSKATMRKIRQNLFLAFIYNILTIPLAAAGLLNPMIAAGTMAMSSVSVISNALLLRYWKPSIKKII